MNKNYSKCLSGDLNYLVTEYLRNLDFLPECELEPLIERIQRNCDYGTLFDFDLNEIKCNYAIKKELFDRLEVKQLSDFYSSYRNLLKMEDDKEVQCMSNPAKMQGEACIQNGYSFLRNLKKGSKVNQRGGFPLERMRGFRHVKSMLGHISVFEDTIINPVPIYCLTYSEDNNLIFTGDNNGLIKIWSSTTGALVEIFKSHDKPINDTLLVNDYLISCSEDMKVTIWDVKKLQVVKTLNFDESLVRVLSYIYINPKSKRAHTIIIVSSLSGKYFIFDLDRATCKNIACEDIDIDDSLFINKFYFDKKIIEQFALKKVKSCIQHSCMSASTKSGVLVCGYNEGLICVWDIQRILDTCICNNKFLYEFDKYVLFLEYVHGSVVHISEFNKDGGYFITSSVDGQVLIWKVRNEIIETIRQTGMNVDRTSSQYEYPIYCVQKISENETRTRCSVNAAGWSCNGNYVFAVISSKKRKRIVPTVINNTNGNLNHSSENNNISNANANSSSNIDQPSKRDSSIVVFSFHDNAVIRRFNETNGFYFHDQCFVLEPHPRFEEIILTVLGTNEIILFNFMSGTVINKFMEHNFFFKNISHNMIASEAKFSSKGDNFVISTFLGSISIYSIYSKNSYSTTYMNQFLDEEFSSNDRSDIGRIFPSYVNMFNLQYITPQPYSRFKLEQVEFLKNRLIRNYNYSNREIEHKMCGNYENYERNFNERAIECEKEEKAFEQAAVENHNYIISDQNEEEESSNEVEDERANEEDMSEYKSSEVEMEEEAEENKDFAIDEEKVSELSNEELREQYNALHDSNTYHLRSRRNMNQNQNSNDSGNAYEDNQIPGNENGNSQNNRRLRLRRHERRNMNENNYDKEDDEDEDDYIIPKRKKRLRRPHKDVIVNDEMEIDIPIENENENENENEILNRDIKDLIAKSDNKDHTCAFCNFTNKSLIGPFYKSEDNDSFTKQPTSNSDPLFFHSDCLLNYNDFLYFSSDNTRFDVLKTIENVITHNQPCWRCGSPYATKKCTNEHCDRYFHGYFCLIRYCFEFEHVATGKTHIQCLTCYRSTISLEIEEKNKGKHKKESIATVAMNAYPKNFFLKERVSYYSYYPQVGETVYFILHSYEEFLKQNFENIIYELNSEDDGDDQIFFWKNIQSNQCNLYHPFLCEVMDFEFAFISPNTIALLKILYSRSWQEKIKILIKMKMKILTLGKVIDILFFENELPDFLIRSEIYETNLAKYQNLLKDKSKTKIDIVIGDQPIQMNIIKYQKTENNINYLDSDFGSIIAQYENDESNNISPTTEPEVLKLSFWEIYDKNFHNEGCVTSPAMKELIKVAKEKFGQIITKNEKVFSPFFDAVDEIRDNAINYYNIIEVPMYLNLIMERLNNSYYLTVESLLYDIHMIERNAVKYNSQTSEIALCAKHLTCELENVITSLRRKILVMKKDCSKTFTECDNTGTRLIGNKRKRLTQGLGFDSSSVLIEIQNESKDYPRSLRARKSNNDRSSGYMNSSGKSSSLPNSLHTTSSKSESHLKTVKPQVQLNFDEESEDGYEENEDHMNSIHQSQEMLLGKKMRLRQNGYSLRRRRDEI